MNQALFKQFATVIVSLPSDDMLARVDGAESVINQAARAHAMHARFPPRGERGRPVDRLLDVFDGHTVVPDEREESSECRVAELDDGPCLRCRLI